MVVVVNLAPNLGDTAYQDYEIKFPQPFGEVPTGIADKIVIVASLELERTNCPDAYTVNVANITNEGFTARVRRIDDNQGWGMTLQLNYIAQLNTIFNSGE